MIAILGGLGAACAWALSTLCSSRSSRMIEPASVVAWVMLVGLLATLPLAIADGIPHGLNGTSVAWMFASGAGNVVGLMLSYAAMRVGQVSLIAPLVSTEGAIAAVIAIAAGESLAPLAAAALVVVAAGIALAAIPIVERSGGRCRRPSRVVALAMTAALAFGVSLYATAKAGSTLPVAWVVLSARLVGAIALAAPFAVLGRLRVTRRVLPLLVTSGVCEVVGFYSYTSGARHGIAVAAVLASQFAALAALAGYLLFNERLGRLQFAGVAAVIAGVALLSVVQA